jgi:hypothetical protein
VTVTASEERSNGHFNNDAGARGTPSHEGPVTCIARRWRRHRVSRVVERADAQTGSARSMNSSCKPQQPPSSAQPGQPRRSAHRLPDTVVHHGSSRLRRVARRSSVSARSSRAPFCSPATAAQHDRTSRHVTRLPPRRSVASDLGGSSSWPPPEGPGDYDWEELTPEEVRAPLSAAGTGVPCGLRPGCRQRRRPVAAALRAVRAAWLCTPAPAWRGND